MLTIGYSPEVFLEALLPYQNTNMVVGHLCFPEQGLGFQKIAGLLGLRGYRLEVEDRNDIDKALAGDSLCAYLHYNRGNVYAAQKDYERAIEDYDKAVAADPNLAEAYYNRGLAKIFSGKAAEGIADLSKAGELGLYNAYSIIKKHRAKAGG